MTAAARPRRPASRLAAIPLAGGLAALSLTPVTGLHQVAGVALVALVCWGAHGVLTRLLPALDAPAAVVLSGVVVAVTVTLLVVGVSAATLAVTRVSMVVTLAAVGAAFAVAGHLLRAGSVPVRRWSRPGPISFAVLTVVACGILVIDAGAVTARLAPRAAPQPFSSFSFAGAASRWSGPLAVSPGQVLTVPLVLYNRTGRQERFVVSSHLGARTAVLAAPVLRASAQWTATFPITVSDAGCPARLTFTARSAAGTELLDVWLRWNHPACA